jgi:hypothetical protein
MTKSAAKSTIRATDNFDPEDQTRKHERNEMPRPRAKCPQSRARRQKRRECLPEITVADCVNASSTTTLSV